MEAAFQWATKEAVMTEENMKESDSTSKMSHYMLMPFTEVVVKSSQLQEESSMLLN